MRLKSLCILELLKWLFNILAKINSRTDKDKIENAKWWAGVLYYSSKYSLSPLHSPIRYLFEGINDHGFDINSPELIQQEIDNGNIKPFPWVRKIDVID